MTAEEEMSCYDLDSCDAVLAFGTVLRDLYGRRGWGSRKRRPAKSTAIPRFIRRCSGAFQQQTPGLN